MAQRSLHKNIQESRERMHHTFQRRWEKVYDDHLPVVWNAAGWGSGHIKTYRLTSVGGGGGCSRHSCHCLLWISTGTKSNFQGDAKVYIFKSRWVKLCGNEWLLGLNQSDQFTGCFIRPTIVSLIKRSQGTFSSDYPFLIPVLAAPYDTVLLLKVRRSRCFKVTLEPLPTLYLS